MRSPRLPKTAESIKRLDADVIRCERCPRLRAHCAAVAKEKRKSFRDQTYWGRPVPNFGSKTAELLIVGLAPAAHGANRTGRMFTGDRSGDWLYRALHKAGFANQPTSVSGDDGLRLIGCVITAVAHCAPPDNKPLPEEISNCSEYLTRTFALYEPSVILALGNIGWNATISELKRQGIWTGARPEFSHGAEVKIADDLVLLGSYHPSQQNTFTGRLTEPMFDKVFSRARSLISR
jgi:uracil-DNA glycosylase